MKAISHHYRILIGTTLVDLRRRYAGSVMGIFWALIGPLLLMGLYAVIYAVVFQIRPPEMTQAAYVLYVFCGLVPFLGFSEALQTGTTSLTANKDLLLNTVFPAEFVPLRAVLLSTLNSALGVALIIVAGALLGELSWWVVLAPVVLLFQGLFVAGIVWIFSLVNLVVRDLQHVLMYATIVLLVASPIAYTPSMIPAAFAPIIYFNPLSYYVMAMQHFVILGEPPSFVVMVIGAALSLLSFGGGSWVFARAKLVFFDYV
jgi:lipopolysaccharide transport system permease protein